MSETTQRIKEHSSCRAFEQRPVEPALIDEIFECARMSSSSCFLQVSSIIRVTDPEKKKIISEACKQPFVAKAPELWIFCGDFHRDGCLCENPSLGWTDHFLVACVDTGIMAQSAMIALESLGLGGVYVGGIRDCVETVHELFRQNPCLIVEELSPDINEEAMFHLYNLYRNEGGNILFTAEEAPARMRFKLKDLQSRLNIIPSVEIKAPDDELLSSLLVKLFMDRQIMVSPEVINYLLNNMQRSFAYARKIVAEIDNLSLARKRAVTVPLVKEAVSLLDDDPQGELFNL